MVIPFKCPYCDSTDTVNKGVRKTKTMGLRKIRRCKGCGRKFTPRNQQATRDDDESTDVPLVAEGIMREPSKPKLDSNEDSPVAKPAPPTP